VDQRLPGCAGAATRGTAGPIPEFLLRQGVGRGDLVSLQVPNQIGRAPT
jgi:hypothetical protein